MAIDSSEESRESGTRNGSDFAPPEKKTSIVVNKVRRDRRKKKISW